MLLNLLVCERLLSFGSGDKGLKLELEPLNVLIGANGSGKSNVLTALGLLQATASDMEGYLRTNGGVFDWHWKGQPSGLRRMCRLSAAIELSPEVALIYTLGFKEENQQLVVVGEELEDINLISGQSGKSIYYTYNSIRPMIRKGRRGKLQPITDFDPKKSIFAQRRDAELYPELTKVGQLFSQIRFYREWRLGRNAPARLTQPADLPNDYLAEDGSNLGLVLNRLKQAPGVRALLLENLRTLYADIEDVDVLIQGNSVQIFLHEAGRVIPGARLSDGTLRWLSLLCVLLHPEPPPMVCIEEPELGLHPDLIPTLAKLLRAASERMQLVVTTHSDALIDALTDIPEAVVVCEKVDGMTQCRRLDKENLKEWLKKYSLGTLWRSGELGGNRW